MNKFLIVIGALLFLGVVKSIPEIRNDYRKGSGIDPPEIQASYDLDVHNVGLPVDELKPTKVYFPFEVFNHRYVRHINIPNIGINQDRWYDNIYHTYADLHGLLSVLDIYQLDNYQRD